MKIVSQGKIYLAEQRVLTKSAWAHQHRTFESSNAHADLPSQKLFLFNEDDLAGGGELSYTVDRQCQLLFIAVTGGINVTAGQMATQRVDVEECLLLTCAPETLVTVKNAYQQELVSYIVIGVATATTHPNSETQKFSMQKNRLSPVCQTENFSAQIGSFDGRKEACYVLENFKIVFLFALNGAFEADGRLMHPKDSLMLWNTPSVELEALSNNAIVLLLAF